MKKVLIFFVLICVIYLTAIPVSAGNYNIAQSSDMSIIYTDDGGYILMSMSTVTCKNQTKSSADLQHRKTYTKYDAQNNISWQYTLTGTFYVNYGVSAVCTGASYDYSINDGSWSFSNGNAYASGNTAYGEGVFTKKFLFITIQTFDVDMSITCDINGNFS